MEPDHLKLAMHGTRGFNAIAEGLPGVSRSVLARRLRKLEELGLIVRDPSARRSAAPYRLAPAGEQLVPTLLSLDSWAKRWVPEDPALAQRDPSIITFWLSHRVDPLQLPDRSVVVAFDIRGPRAQQQWLVLEQGASPSICAEDPGLSCTSTRSPGPTSTLLFFFFALVLCVQIATSTSKPWQPTSTQFPEGLAVGAPPWPTGRSSSMVTLGSSRPSRVGSSTRTRVTI